MKYIFEIDDSVIKENLEEIKSDIAGTLKEAFDVANKWTGINFYIDKEDQNSGPSS